MQQIFDKFKNTLGPDYVYRVKLNPERSLIYGDIAVARGTSDDTSKEMAANSRSPRDGPQFPAGKWPMASPPLASLQYTFCRTGILAQRHQLLRCRDAHLFNPLHTNFSMHGANSFWCLEKSLDLLAHAVASYLMRGNPFLLPFPFIRWT
jgi:hypothetical protein